MLSEKSTIMIELYNALFNYYYCIIFYIKVFITIVDIKTHLSVINSEMTKSSSENETNKNY